MKFFIGIFFTDYPQTPAPGRHAFDAQNNARKLQVRPRSTVLVFQKIVAGRRMRRNVADPLNIRPNNGCLELRNFFSVRVGDEGNKFPLELKDSWLSVSKLPFGYTERERCNP